MLSLSDRPLLFFFLMIRGPPKPPLFPYPPLFRLADPGGFPPPRAEGGTGLHGRVVLLVRPAFRRDGRVVEEAEKDLVGRGRGDVGRRALAAECHDPGILLRLRMIDRAVLDQPSARDFRDDLIPPP